MWMQELVEEDGVPAILIIMQNVKVPRGDMAETFIRDPEAYADVKAWPDFSSVRSALPVVMVRMGRWTSPFESCTC
jgi:hypothetical protein